MYTDADIELAEMEAIGNQIHRLEKQGICTHGSTVGYNPNHYYPQQVGLKPGQVACRDCPEVFASDDDWIAAMNEVLS